MTETGGPQQGRAAGLPCVVAPQKGRGLGAQRAVCKPQNRLLNLLKPRFPALKWQNAISSRQESMRRGKEARNTGRDLCAGSWGPGDARSWGPHLFLAACTKLRLGGQWQFHKQINSGKIITTKFLSQSTPVHEALGLVLPEEKPAYLRFTPVSLKF